MTDPSTTGPNGGGDATWFQRPENVRKLIAVLVAAVVASVAAQLVFGMHGHFPIESWPVFFGAFGFLAYASIVLTAKLLRRIVMRPEDYYDR